LFRPFEDLHGNASLIPPGSGCPARHRRALAVGSQMARSSCSTQTSRVQAGAEATHKQINNQLTMFELMR
jgi:hypothetical protein